MTTYWTYSHEFFVDVMKRVAPERSDEIQQNLTDLGIHLETDTMTEGICFCAKPKEKTIVVGVRCLGRIWAHAFGYLWFYTLISEGKRKDPRQKSVDLKSTEQLRQAGAVLGWATTEDINIRVAADMGITYTPSEMPPSLPLPFDPSKKDSHHRLAGDLTIMALGFVLFHELAHLVLGHRRTTGVVSIEQEKDADRWAAEMMVGAPSVDALCRKKRLLSIAIGMLWLVKFEVYLGVSANDTHPPSYDRLYQLLDQFVNETDQSRDGESNTIWSFVQVALGIHMQHEGHPLDQTRKFNTFKECVNYYVDVLSQA